MPKRLTKTLPKGQKPRGLNYDQLRQMMADEHKAQRNDPALNAFVSRPPQPLPGVLPKGAKPKLANDTDVINFNGWAVGQLQNNAINSGVVFLGFPYLSELAQIPEYRYIAEVTATEMTREWIDIKSKARDKSKEDKINQLGDFMKKLDVRGHFQRLAELDYFFGRAHLYLDTGDTDKPDELKVPIGNGRDAATLTKGLKLQHLKCVEPIWCYPAEYTSNNPLKQDWYNPQSWYALGQLVHVSRLLTLVGREVPDMLKPSFMFGGLPMSQMAQPTVQNWLRARKSVSDLLWRYSVNVLSTEMDATSAEGGLEMVTRANLLSQFMNNNGVFMLDKDTEEFQNVSTPLGTIDQLQAQAQEHQSAVSRIPLVKLTGISPSGLNASSEGEIQVWYEWIKAYQEKLFNKPLDTVICLSQITLWGKVDPDIVWNFKPLKALSAKELAELQKIKADTDAIYVQVQAVSPDDLRRRLSNDPESPYEGLGELGPDEIDEMDDLAAQTEQGLGNIFKRTAGQVDCDGGPRPAREPRTNEREPREGRNRSRGSRERLDA